MIVAIKLEIDISASTVRDAQGRELSSVYLYEVHSFMKMYISLIEVMTKNGPWIEPGGTTLFHRETRLPLAFPISQFVFDLVNNWLSDCKQICQGHMSNVQPLINDAFDKSANNTQCLLSSSANCQSSIHLTRSVWQLWPVWNAFQRSLRMTQINSTNLLFWTHIIPIVVYNYLLSSFPISSTWDLLLQLSYYQEKCHTACKYLTKRWAEWLTHCAPDVRVCLGCYHIKCFFLLTIVTKFLGSYCVSG